ncbi:DUF998 domain-containing protein [Methanolacinia paynteri]|uniref:DUF998 domain-containing protein n=1 Tax=Methanolacinia paynteri TaxID=230356 RepID=UPI00064FF5A4|nr:DUF998 domain-containing protein [Methanolacinia paynteri]
MGSIPGAFKDDHEMGFRLIGFGYFLAGIIIILAIIIAEAVYPGYHVTQYISDLGAPSLSPHPCIFNISIIIYGFIVFLVSLFFLLQNRSSGSGNRCSSTNSKTISFIFIMISGICAIGVGAINEDLGVAHTLCAAFTFIFGILAAFFSGFWVKIPYNVISAIIAVFSFIALLFLVAEIDLGIGLGGIERMVAYPLILWEMGLGGYLMNEGKAMVLKEQPEQSDKNFIL